LSRERLVWSVKVLQWQCVCEAAQQNSDTVNQGEPTRFPLRRNDSFRPNSIVLAGADSSVVWVWGSRSMGV